MTLHLFLYIIGIPPCRWSVSAQRFLVDMGNYVQSHLTKEEHVVFEAHYSWCIWILPVIAFLFLSAPLLLALQQETSYGETNDMGFPCAVFLLGVWILIYTFIRTQTDEFAITNQRLIIKTGVISRTTLELNLTKVETISVDQDIVSRLFDAGQVSIKGTGSTICNLKCIDAPFDFRKAFQNVLGTYIPTHINDGFNMKPDVDFIRRNADVNVQQTSSAPTQAKGGITEKSESLLKLKSLLDAGILTQEEFDAEKKKILNA